MAWHNSDGLYIKYGTEKATANRAGEYRTPAEFREVEVLINLADLTETETIQSDEVFIPAGFEIAQVQIWVNTVAATGVAIDVGLIRTDRSTEIDYNGILAAFETATMTAGNKVTLVKGGTQVGALVGSGSALSNTGYITASRTTSTAFTTGQIRVKIQLIKP